MESAPDCEHKLTTPPQPVPLGGSHPLRCRTPWGVAPLEGSHPFRGRTPRGVAPLEGSHPLRGPLEGSFFHFSNFQIFDFSYFHFCKRYATHPRQLIGVCKINAYSWFMKLCAVPQHPPGVTRTRRALSVFRCFSCVRHTFFIKFLKKSKRFWEKNDVFFCCFLLASAWWKKVMTVWWH